MSELNHLLIETEFENYSKRKANRVSAFEDYDI